MFKRTSILLYGVICYAVFFATFLYAIGFIGNLWVPRAIDSPREVDFTTALLVDLGLLMLFAVQHSVMARPAFKRAWTKIVPVAAERSTYVLFSSLALIALFYFWQPLGGVVWQVQSQAAQYALLGMYAFGWGLVLLATFLIDHFDLFGLRQSWYGFRGEPMPPLAFRTPWLYRHVRHPLYVGWLLVLIATFLINHFDLFGLRQSWLALRGIAYRPVNFRQPWLYRQVRHPLYLGFFIALWATPTMTVTHLVFAVVASAYIVVGTLLEERDLKAAHPEYAEYARRVPRYIPGLKKPQAQRPAVPATR